MIKNFDYELFFQPEISLGQVRCSLMRTGTHCKIYLVPVLKIACEAGTLYAGHSLDTSRLKMMARITAEEKRQKKERMDECIVKIFLNEGWSSVTYDRLAKEFNVRKSSIQAYYPSSIMFATALQGVIFPLFLEMLDFETKDKFIDSWVSAYEDESNHVFREVVEMLLQNILKDGTSPYSRGGVLRLKQHLAQTIGEGEATSAIKSVFGELVYRKMYD
ncbi:TetR/AcrR family transcriptional regulator [Vibrio sp. E150_011]